MYKQWTTVLFAPLSQEKNGLLTSTWRILLLKKTFVFVLDKFLNWKELKKILILNQASASQSLQFICFLVFF